MHLVMDNPISKIARTLTSLERRNTGVIYEMRCKYFVSYALNARLVMRFFTDINYYVVTELKRYIKSYDDIENKSYPYVLTMKNSLSIGFTKNI